MTLALPVPPVLDELPTWLQPRIPDLFSPLKTPCRLCCIMQKGGTSKTTTTVCLACELALMGFKVRIWDLDPQEGSATSWMPPQTGVSGTPRNLLHMFKGEASPDEVTYPTAVPNLSIVPSYTSLKQAEVDSEIVGVEQGVAWGIENSTETFDVEIADCGPSLGKLTVAGMIACPELIIPLKASGLDMRSMTSLNRTIELTKRVQPKLNRRAVLLAEVLKTNLTRAMFDLMCRDFPEALVMGVRSSTAAREAPLPHILKPLHEYAPEATVRLDYQFLGAALVERRTA
ncbi:ParA family protein [Streptosporangium sp. NPDC023615]|uniref:ParA family protein n=1 Tax=Streptosporangium sp. NPDC023615 TaxID=3154794 RepID=UPI00342300FB